MNDTMNDPITLAATVRSIEAREREASRLMRCFVVPHRRRDDASARRLPTGWEASFVLGAVDAR